MRFPSLGRSSFLNCDGLWAFALLLALACSVKSSKCTINGYRVEPWFIRCSERSIVLLIVICNVACVFIDDEAGFQAMYFFFSIRIFTLLQIAFCGLIYNYILLSGTLRNQYTKITFALSCVGFNRWTRWSQLSLKFFDFASYEEQEKNYACFFFKPSTLRSF